MASYEEQLIELASGESWNMTNLKSLIAAVEKQEEKVDKVISALPEYWKGQSSEVLLERMKVHKNNLAKLKEHIYAGQQQVTGLGQSVCAATCDNTDRMQQAQMALDNLPSTILPTSVLDQINSGAEFVEVHSVGRVNLAAKGVGWITEQLTGNREKAAKKAVDELSTMIHARGQALEQRTVTFDPLPTIPGGETSNPGLTPPGGVNPYGMGPIGGTSGPGGGGGAIPGVAPGTGGSGSGVSIPTGVTGVNSSFPNGHEIAWDPHKPYDPNFPGDDGIGTGDFPYPDGPGIGDTNSTGISADSSMDDGYTGSEMRSGLGAAGLGGVGMAAGSKLAGGGAGRLGGIGGLGGFGGFGGGGAGGAHGGVIGSTAGAGSSGAKGTGVRGAGAGSGLRGAGAGAGGSARGVGAGAGAGAGAGGNGAGAGAGKGAGVARPGGMMMGGHGGAGSDRKGSINRLGYVAPKFEDDYEENMPHPAARAGKRKD